MRICPKCGYADPPYWKQCAFRQNISYATISDIEFHLPKLGEKLRQHSYIDEGFYAYHLTKGGRVERQAISDNPMWRTQWYVGTFERSIHNKLPSHLRTPSELANKTLKARKNQRRLFDVPTPQQQQKQEQGTEEK